MTTQVSKNLLDTIYVAADGTEPMTGDLTITGTLTASDGILSVVADGATADAHIFDTTNAFTTSGASILTLKTNAVEKVSVECNSDANDYYKIRLHDTEATLNNFYFGYSDTDTDYAGMFNDHGDFWLGVNSNKTTYVNYYNGGSIDLGASTNRNIVTSYVGNLSTTGHIIDGALKVKKVIEASNAIASSGAIALNLDAATYFYNTSTTGVITFTFSNPSGTALTVSSFMLELFGGGTNAPVWPASVKWPNGTEPTWTTGIDLVSFVTRDGGTTWLGMLSGTAFA